MGKIHFQCDYCGQRIRALPDMAGELGKCPFCGHKNKVPDRSQRITRSRAKVKVLTAGWQQKRRQRRERFRRVAKPVVDGEGDRSGPIHDLTASDQLGQNLGVTGMIVSVLGLLTFGFLSPLGVLLSALGMNSPPRGRAVVGLLLGLLGTWVLYWYGYDRVVNWFTADSSVNIQQIEQTRSSIRRVYEQIVVFRRTNNDLPGVDEAAAYLDEFPDAWDRRLRYTLASDDTFTISSAGRDGEFRTDDDVSSDDPEFADLWRE